MDGLPACPPASQARRRLLLVGAPAALAAPGGCRRDPKPLPLMLLDSTPLPCPCPPCSENVIFIFLVHPFDVGDTLLLRTTDAAARHEARAGACARTCAACLLPGLVWQHPMQRGLHGAGAGDGRAGAVPAAPAAALSAGARCP